MTTDAASVHLVHGMGTAPAAPTWPAITLPEAAAIITHFPGAGRPIGLRWHSPRPFSAATLVQTSRGTFLLKRHHRCLRTVEGLGEEHGFIAHLASAGLPVAPVMTGATGTAVADGEWCYELHRKAPGLDLYRDRTSWTPFLSYRHARAAGAALARLHRAAVDYDAPPRPPHPLVASLTILPAPDPLAAAEAYVAARPALAHYLADRPWRLVLARLFAAASDGLASRLADRPPLWTHNDWHPSNLLWTADGEVRSIFDFGLSTRTCALHDIATAIERSAIEWLRLGKDEAIGDADAARALLDGYAAVTALSADEIETVVRLLPLVHVEFALSEIDYFSGIVGDREQAETAWETYLIGHADWFLSPAGQAFLAGIRRATAA